MDYPAKAPLSKEGVHGGYVCLGEDFGVSDFALPGDTKNSGQAPHMEGLKFPFLMRIGRPRFAAVKQGTDDTGLVGFDFGGDSEMFVIQKNGEPVHLVRRLTAAAARTSVRLMPAYGTALQIFCRGLLL